MLNIGSENGTLVHALRGNVFDFSLLSMMLAVGLSYMTFVMLKYVPYIHILPPLG